MMEQITNERRHGDMDPGAAMARMMRRPVFRHLKGRILIVDDEAEVVSVLQELLGLAGLQVETAHSGRQAMDLLRTAGPFDLVISDMKMPEMDGLELLKRFHNLEQPIPVVIITGYGTVANGIHAIEEGAWDYLLKPINTENLMLVVQGALRSRTARA